MATTVITVAIIIVGIVLLSSATFYSLCTQAVETQDRSKRIHLRDTCEKGPVLTVPVSHEDTEAGAVYSGLPQISQLSRGRARI